MFSTFVYGGDGMNSSAFGTLTNKCCQSKCLIAALAVDIIASIINYLVFNSTTMGITYKFNQFTTCGKRASSGSLFVCGTTTLTS